MCMRRQCRNSGKPEALVVPAFETSVDHVPATKDQLRREYYQTLARLSNETGSGEAALSLTSFHARNGLPGPVRHTRSRSPVGQCCVGCWMSLGMSG